MLRQLCKQLASSLRTGSAGCSTSYPAASMVAQASCSTSAAPADAAHEAKRRGMANMLMYRSKQRGFLELDLLVGLWAEKNIPTMSLDKLEHLTVVLDQENPDLFKWLTGQLPPSEEMAANPAFQEIKLVVDKQLAGYMAPKSAAASGREWVRGWSDGGDNKQVAPGAPTMAQTANQ